MINREQTMTTAPACQEQADDTVAARRSLARTINHAPGDRESLAARYGQVWDTKELQAEFEVLGFMAPFVVVSRKADGRKGSLQFQHQPRFYFSFLPD